MNSQRIEQFKNLYPKWTLIKTQMVNTDQSKWLKDEYDQLNGIDYYVFAREPNEDFFTWFFRHENIAVIFALRWS